MKTPDFKELYKPYAKMVVLEDTIAWILKECTSRGINADIARKAINMTFLEMANGKTFPVDGGDTGFDGVPHACMNVYVVQKAIEMHKKSMTAYLEATQGELQSRINTHIRRNKWREYKDHLKRNSPIVKLFIRKDK